MINSVNPYCPFPFFTQDYNEVKEFPLLAPTESFPPFQVKVSGTGLAYSWKLRDLSDNSTTVISGALLAAIETDDSETYIIHDGAAHGLTLTENQEYVIELTIEGTVYYSHSFVACSAFDIISDSTVVITDTDLGLGANEWSMDVAFNDTTGPGTRVLFWRLTTSDTWIRLGENTGLIVSDDDTETGGTITFEVRGVIYNGAVTIERIYSAFIDSADPLNTFGITLKTTRTTGLDNILYLEWDNTNDLQAYDLYYQGAYKNKFYFEGYRGISVPVEEEAFERNGQNDLILESAGLSEEISFEISPLSEYVFMALSAAKYHDSVTLYRAVDGTSQAARKHTLSFTPNVDNPLIPYGEMSFERNYAFIAGCQENETVI
jgi:hypothetical protein